MNYSDDINFFWRKVLLTHFFHRSYFIFALFWFPLGHAELVGESLKPEEKGRAKTTLEQKTIEVVGLPIPPYIIVEEGKSSGILIDLLKAVFQQLDIKVTFKISNWARSYSQIQADTTDAIIPTFYSSDRAEFLRYPATPLLYFEMVLAGGSGGTYTYDGDIEQLAPYTIGRIRNAKVAPEFDKAVAQHIISVQERNNIDLLVAAIARGRLDLAVMERRALEWSALKQRQRELVKILQPTLSYQPVYIAFNNNRVSKELVDKVNAVLLQLNENGSIEKIVNRYLGEDVYKYGW